MDLRRCLTFLILLLLATPARSAGQGMVDTGQKGCWGDERTIPCPKPGERFFGQDGNYQGAEPTYRDNEDGTVSDLNTGLMWSKVVDPAKVGPEAAGEIAKGLRLGGHSDWRVPNIKELYSLIDFRGYTGFDGGRDMSRVPRNAIPYIDTDHFDFRYGDTSGRERYIDAQWITSTLYGGRTMGHMITLFGVNFADGRIKGYGFRDSRGGPDRKKFFARYVRGPAYGQNLLEDNGNGTIADRATGLIWMQEDSGRGMDWGAALGYCEDLVACVIEMDMGFMILCPCTPGDGGGHGGSGDFGKEVCGEAERGRTPAPQ